MSLLGPKLCVSQVLKNGRSLLPGVANATNDFVWMTKMYDSGFHQKKFPEFRDPDCPTWDEVCTSSWHV